MDIPASTGMAATSVSMKHVLLSEILSVTSVMRKNSRWASSAHSFSPRDSALASSLGLRRTKQYFDSDPLERGSTEQELMTGFQDLKRLVKDLQGQFSSCPNSFRCLTKSYRRTIITFDLSSFSLLRNHSVASIDRAYHIRRALRTPYVFPMRPRLADVPLSTTFSIRAEQCNLSLQVRN